MQEEHYCGCVGASDRIEHRVHPHRMRRGPVDPAALFAFGKSIMAGKDVGRHSARQKFACNWSQRTVASRASCKCNRPRVEAEASDSLAQLAPDGVALDEKNVGRRSEAFVARQQDSVLCASDLQQPGAGQRRVGNNVGAEQPQPSRQSEQHPVGGKSGSFIHRVRLYYITAPGISGWEKYKATV